MAVASDRIYLAFTKCRANPCLNSDPQELYAVGAAVGAEYPQGVTFPQPSPTTPTLNYVALGDSFSSGEGVPPYYEGTNKPSKNGNFNLCHRSQLAYPRLLGADNTLHLKSVGNFTCSGAETKHITRAHQYRTQPPQILLLTKNTDIVTLTIGGNDVGFGEFAEACVIPLQSCTASVYQKVVRTIDNQLPGKLRATYGTLAQKLDTKASVLVIGYPMLVRALKQRSVSRCGYLSAQEQINAHDVIVRLNGTIKRAVNAAAQNSRGPKFVYIDAATPGSPFEGHDLCGGSSYFNRPSASRPIDNIGAASLHPNKQGQEAYYRLIKDYLMKH